MQLQSLAKTKHTFVFPSFGSLIKSLPFLTHTDTLAYVLAYETVLHSFVHMHIQWHSQDIADARAQHGHTTFVQTPGILEFYSLQGRL